MWPGSKEISNWLTHRLGEENLRTEFPTITSSKTYKENMLTKVDIVGKDIVHTPQGQGF